MLLSCTCMQSPYFHSPYLSAGCPGFGRLWEWCCQWRSLVGKTWPRPARSSFQQRWSASGVSPARSCLLQFSNRRSKQSLVLHDRTRWDWVSKCAPWVSAWTSVQLPPTPRLGRMQLPIQAHSHRLIPCPPLWKWPTAAQSLSWWPGNALVAPRAAGLPLQLVAATQTKTWHLPQWSCMPATKVVETCSTTSKLSISWWCKQQNDSKTHLKATQRLPMVKRARGDRAPVAVLLVRSISSSDLPMLITTRIAVLSPLWDDAALAGLPAAMLPPLSSELRDTCQKAIKVRPDRPKISWVGRNYRRTHAWEHCRK